MTSQHGGKTKLVCPDCGDVFSSKTSLNSHISRKHSKDSDKKFQCHECSFFTSYPSDLKRHSRVHDIRLKPQPCPFCSRLVKNLQEHFHKTQCDIPESERTIKKYKCDTCNKNFSWKGGYERHVKNFHSEGAQSHKCELCSYATYSKFNLFIHVRRMHEGKKLKRTCPHCLKEVIKLEFHIRLFHPEFANLPVITDD